MEIPAIAVPAVLAFTLNIFLFVYAGRAEVKNRETRLYLLFLFALSVQNLAEIAGFYFIHQFGYFPLLDGLTWFSASIFAIAFLLHLVVSLSSSARAMSSRLLLFVYAPMALLQMLLWFTSLLVEGFEPKAYSYTQIPGPYYFLFEVFVAGYLLAVIALLANAAFRARLPSVRAKNAIMLVGLLPILAIVLVVLALQHFGVHHFNATGILPIAVTFFLAVTAYATHHYRLFDIQFYIPWSKVRKRKTAFYNRIRAMIAEIADLDSVEIAVNYIADVLRCPVAIVGAGRPVVAMAGAKNFRINIPAMALRGFERIIVRNEIAETMPAVHELMMHNGIAAMVPFHPHSKSASGWLLLGEAFSDQVYTDRDFKAVEELFDVMADLFLDKLVTIRSQLAEAQRHVYALEARQAEAQREVLALKSENADLHRLVDRLRQQQSADSLLAQAEVVPAVSHVRLTLIGRDKEALKVLRNGFPQITHYTSIGSAGFRQKAVPDILVCRLDEDTSEANALARFLGQADARLATVVYGAGAPGFISDNKSLLAGRIVEVLPDDANEAQVVRRIEALSVLVRAVFAIPQSELPLIGESRPFVEQMQQARRMSALVEPLLIQTSDMDAACALAQYIHEQSASTGPFRILNPAEISSDDVADAPQLHALVESIVSSVREGTLMVTHAEVLPDAFAARLFESADRTSDVRLIAACPGTTAPEALMRLVQPILLQMPAMRQRKQDLPLLAHYFTLQFNLQTGEQRYLTQSALEELLAGDCPSTMGSFRRCLFERLSQGQSTPGDNENSVPEPVMPEGQDNTLDKTLDEHIAQFEARIITETLKRCGGNKSKAARLLGLRPNTLHYKLTRYGIGKNT